MKRLLAAFLAGCLILGGVTALGEEVQADPEPVQTVAPPARIVELHNGSKGEEVRILQLRLAELGYLEGSADGVYGAMTREAVRRFQQRNGLSVDGVAGKKTQNRLYSPEAIPAPEPAEPTDVLAGDWPMLTNLQHPVGEDFVPADLVLMTDLCDADLVKIKYENTKGVRTAVEALIRMLEDARADGLTKWQVSAGYRSYAEQESMMNSRINSYLRNNPDWSKSRARRAALQTVAEPGASEHHLGLSFDVNVPGASNFSSTKQCAWLSEHCWEYGFIIRYQADKKQITGFSPEPWHIRYVGTEHSLIMQRENLCLEEYLEKYMPDEVEEKIDTDGEENTQISDEPEEYSGEG